MRASSTRLLVVSFLLYGCLPTDERPTPGKAEVRVVTDPGSDDFMTEDGWRVRLDEVYASVGHVRLEPLEQERAECQQYASSPYLRVVDLLEASTRLATLFARGPCALRFQMEGPGEHPIASEVDDSIVEAMRAYGTDAFVADQSIALWVAGSAERDAQEVRFAWRFRQSFDYDPCASAELTPGGEAELIELRVRLPALLSDPSDSRLRFDALATADVNGDGEVTLDEIAAHDRMRGEHLYFQALPSIFRIGQSAPCFVGRITTRFDYD